MEVKPFPHLYPSKMTDVFLVTVPPPQSVMNQQLMERPARRNQGLEHKNAGIWAVPYFLLFAAVGGQLALAAIADEVIGRVPVLDHVEPLVDLVLSLPRGQVVAEEDTL